MRQVPPGSILRVNLGPYDHVGMATDGWMNGQQCIISNSKRHGCVVEETLSDFANGHGFEVSEPFAVLPEREVMRRARSLLGRPWSLFNSNCEHFVREASGIQPKSPQVRSAVAIGLACLVVGGLLRDA